MCLILYVVLLTGIEPATREGMVSKTIVYTVPPQERIL